MSSLWNRHMYAFLEISSITVLCYLLFRCYRKSVTLTVFFLCTILSSFLAMRSTSWSFTMFKGSRLFDGAYARASIYVWKCARLCVSFSGSMRGIHCLSLGSPLLWSRACGKCSFTGHAESNHERTDQYVRCEKRNLCVLHKHRYVCVQHVATVVW